MSEPTAPFRVRALRVKDFRSLRALELSFSNEFDEPLSTVVFAGPNGSGKTAVLEALVLGLGRASLLPDDAAPLRDQVRFGASRFVVQVDCSRGEQSAARMGLSVDVASNAVSADQDQRYGLVAPPSVEYYSARRALEGLGESPDARGKRSVREARRLVELKRRIVALRLRALTKRQPPTEDSPFVRLQRFWQEFSLDPRELDVLERGGDGEDASEQEVVLREAGKPIPDDIVSLAQARRLAPEREDIPAMVPVDRLSTGQLALVTLAGTLLFRDAPLDVLLIDEPEQHLHAGWHPYLLRALRGLSPATQFFVATHSAAVLGSVSSGERFLLVDGGNAIEHGIDTHPEATDEMGFVSSDEAAE